MRSRNHSLSGLLCYILPLVAFFHPASCFFMLSNCTNKSVARFSGMSLVSLAILKYVDSVANSVQNASILCILIIGIEAS